MDKIDRMKKGKREKGTGERERKGSRANIKGRRGQS
jgi:hypothetical protein